MEVNMKTFRHYTAAQAAEHQLFDFMLRTLIDNLQYLYDDPMDTPENRNMWLSAVMKTPDWHVIVAFDHETPCAFLQYSIRDEALYIGDIQIVREYKLHPLLLCGLLTCCFRREQGHYRTVFAHINKKNAESQKNFLRFGKIVGDTGKSYRVEITEPGFKMIERLCRTGE